MWSSALYSWEHSADTVLVGVLYDPPGCPLISRPPLLGGGSGGVGSGDGHHIIIAVIAPPTATATAVKALTIFLIASAQASARCPTSSACIILEYHISKRTKNFRVLYRCILLGILQRILLRHLKVLVRKWLALMLRQGFRRCDLFLVRMLSRRHAL